MGSVTDHREWLATLPGRAGAAGPHADAITTVTTPTARWSRGGYAAGAPRCRYCGLAQSHDCQPVSCAACGSRQCHGHGGANGTCAVCYVGYLPGWGRPDAERLCGYKGCGGEAAAIAPRVRRVCRAHLARARILITTVTGARARVTLVEYITTRVAHRDSGKGWERWRWVP